ncbi:MAG: DDE-type integrase/transposase/recombinase [Nitrososphaerales archaeon]|nr:DDE-type integrase/transposase/recombinase [Nitrososphaerales archaeon]
MNQFNLRATFNEREARGSEIAHEFGWVQRVDEFSYRVHSQKLDKEYQVQKTETGWACSCPDSKYRLVKCKHVWAVEISWTLREQVRKSVVIQTVKIDVCLFCGSGRLVKDGIRRNKTGDIQKFECRECGRYFTVNIGFEKMKHDPKGITMAIQLYFSGESLRNTQKALRLLGVQVSHQTIYKWIQKYVGLMDRYLDKLTPQVSDTWRADELYFKVRGNMKYLFAMMDDETRFWIAQQVSDTKFKAGVRPLFAEAKRVAGKRPLTLITDGGHHFNQPFKKEFYSKHAPFSMHVRDIRLSGQVHNNKMERMNGEIRDREKVMRGLKRKDTPILKGYQIYHNFIRPHESLNGETPAEKAGIKVEGSDKWLTIIQNASLPTKVDREPKEVESA